MMPPKGQKRKRTSSHEASPSVRKKGKVQLSSQTGSASSEDSQFEVRAILRERKVRKQIQYLLDWEPHPVTGETWSPSWAAAKDVGDLLIKEWIDKKSKAQPQQESQQNSGTHDHSTADSDSGVTIGPITPLPNAQRSNRNRPVIHSSSPASESTPPSPQQPTPFTVQETPSSPQDSATSLPPFERALTPVVEDIEHHPIVRVHVIRQDDFDPGEYQIGLTQALPPRPRDSSVAEAEETPVTTRFEPQAVIPDSQSLSTLSSLDAPRARLQSAGEFSHKLFTSSVQEVSLT
jgi:hypothetical protein